MGGLFQIDWRIFMAGVEAWLQGRNPYGVLSPEFSAGAFAYPPTALPWLALFLLLGPLGYYVWTGLELGLWWWLIRRENRWQIMLLFWSPMVLHLVEGQSSLAPTLVLWAATRAQRRGWLWGLAIAWAMTKPQVALVPMLWLLWHDRAAEGRWKLWGGIALGTLLLALPATLMSPGIWGLWLDGLAAYRGRILQMAAWQGPSALLLALAAYLWYRHYNQGWQWWLAAAMFPQTSFYGIVPALPALHIRPKSNWALAGIGLAAVLQVGVSEATLPWLLAAHVLVLWVLVGGPTARRPAR